MEESKIVVEPLKDEFVQEVYDLERSLLGSGDIDAIKNTIGDEFLEYYVLHDGDKVLGFLEGKIILNEAEIYDICIREDEQGKGYSKFLMDHFIAKAVNFGCDTILLEVNTMNYKAISLYEKYGFKEYGTRKNYYGNSDAILMKKEL